MASNAQVTVIDRVTGIELRPTGKVSSTVLIFSPGSACRCHNRFAEASYRQMISRSAGSGMTQGQV